MTFSPVSNAEATLYYSGLPSDPRLVYRTGTKPWIKPFAPEAYPVSKELRPVFGHKLNTVWNDLAPKVRDLLDSEGVLWTSIDIVRFLEVDKEQAVGPVVLWIGVAPETLSAEDAYTTAHGCLDILNEFEITDVEPVSNYHPTVDVCGPLTHALGLFIAAQATPHIEGIGGLYLAEGGDSKNILLVTARHVLFPPNEGPNVNYPRTKNSSTHRRDVLLLGTKAFDNLIESIERRIRGHDIDADLYNRQIGKLQKREAGEDEGDVEEATKQRKKIQKLLDEANNAMEALDGFHDQVMRKWSKSQRILGHIVRSPPITPGAGTEGFTEDYAIVELDRSKFETAFKGNVIDLGTKYPVGEFTRRMNPHLDFTKQMYPHIDPTRTFTYPIDRRLFELRDLMEEDQMHNPDIFDYNGEPCPLVIKNGNATGITIGCANGIFSFVREYYINGTHQTSMEWAILPYDYKSRVFAAPGDSGSIIADGRGRIGGLLTGGAGKTETSDVTYATPFFWLLPRIKDNGFPNAHLYPVVA